MKIILICFLAIAGFFLITEHRAHIYGILPYLLAFSCVFMHFLHGGHDGKKGGKHEH